MVAEDRQAAQTTGSRLHTYLHAKAEGGHDGTPTHQKGANFKIVKFAVEFCETSLVSPQYILFACSIQELMQAENIKYSARNTTTIDPSDLLARDLYHLLVGHENTAELLYSTLEETVTQLASDKISQHSLVGSKRKELTTMVDNM